ncbi:phosphoribosylglycinamide formyltransferase [Caldibacillus lycopersici]|uniref:Phosphoribosylglycinamide formyltransferase n=1 Tax=Perspicuibacillus lycopersici TaxID=1325689 RepID=A0AAE3ITQ2_9BACI|nr:phosphoribosylglycinamide formyltransferase [Perspicuibacillus lycopersici]MCU9614311.1 phosphoribosylglycinamide formyltransferase [Perspicuibacillus lycopersici]
MNNLAVFASGSGSNFQAIVDAIKQGQLDAKVVLLVCDKPNAFVLQRAEKEGIPYFLFNPKDYPNKTAYETIILANLQKLSIDYIVLAGYMRLIGETILSKYEEKIVNIHPSLLPAFPGKDAIGQALQAGVKVTGVTIHYVDEGMDTGTIIDQHAVSISPDDTKESLQKKVQEIEHQLYPSVLKRLLKKIVNT